MFDMGKSGSGGSVTVGALIVFCGALLILMPALTTVKVAMLFGWIMLISGALTIANAFRGSPNKILDIVTGGVTAVAGLYLVLNPLLAAKALILVVIVVALIRGATGLFSALTKKKDRALVLVVSLIDLMVAVVLWRADLVVAARLVGVYIAFTIILWGITVIVAGSLKEETAAAA